MTNPQSADVPAIASTPRVSTFPVVTGIFLSFNTGDFVVRAIQSALEGGYPSLEIICIDDGSSDGTSVGVLQDFHEKTRFGRLILNPDNRGIPSNLNRALELSTGRYVFFVGDDELLPDKIWQDVATLEGLDEDIALVHSIAQDMSHDGSALFPSFHPSLPFPSTIPDRPSFEDMLRAGGFVSAPTAVLRRSALEAMGGWNEDLLYEDKPMWLALASAGYGFRFRPAVSVHYRRHSQQATAFARPGSIAYQMRVYAQYDEYPEARRQMRRAMLAACAARLDGNPDLAECVEVYRHSHNHSRILLLAARYQVLTAAAWLRRKVKRRR